MLRVDLKPSRVLTLALIAAHAGAAAALFPLELPAAAKAGLAVLIAVSLVRALYRHAWLRNGESVVAIQLAEHGDATVETRCGERHAAQVLDTTYVSARLCVVNLRLAQRFFARHALIVPDNVDAEAFRRLRVWLRWAYRRDGLTS